MIRLSDDEAWEVLDSSRTGILTTLRRDGRPVTLPVWYVTQGRTICVSTPAGTKKVRRVRHDPRASFLVESGEKWSELTAVHVSGNIEIVSGESDCQAIADEISRKYSAFQAPAATMPDSARERYQSQVYLRLVPEGRILTWDNSRLLRGGS
jgi:PPOX class probable F420-dependent enzyme